MDVREAIDEQTLLEWNDKIHDLRVLMSLNGEDMLCYLSEMAQLELLTLLGSNDGSELNLDFMKKTNTKASSVLLREWGELVRDIELEATSYGEEFLAYLLEMVISEIDNRILKIPETYLRLLINNDRI